MTSRCCGRPELSSVTLLIHAEGSKSGSKVEVTTAFPLLPISPSLPPSPARPTRHLCRPVFPMHNACSPSSILAVERLLRYFDKHSAARKQSSRPCGKTATNNQTIIGLCNAARTSSCLLGVRGEAGTCRQGIHRVPRQKERNSGARGTGCLTRRLGGIRRTQRKRRGPWRNERVHTNKSETQTCNKSEMKRWLLTTGGTGRALAK